MSTRRRGREHVLKALYAFELAELTMEEIIESVLENGSLDEKTLEFARRLFNKVIESLDSIDERIGFLATNWKLERIAIVDKNILRMAICEINHSPDVPVKVAIDEAIELAKKYSTLESASFVNGILNQVMQDSE